MPSKKDPVPRESFDHRGVSTRAVHAGEARQKPGDAITDAIFCASTYTFPSTQAVIDFIEQKQSREEYGRYGNPNQRVVERKMAALEGAEQAALFSSGMAAIGKKPPGGGNSPLAVNLVGESFVVRANLANA